ncbi:MAG: chemotaxis protein CheW, partial [Acidobacteria bacterium]|nr:chemotaxis protein CheW [Acidobacteriota bacterium]
MPALPVNAPADCWNRIGVRGDHSCPELLKVVHCHNCPVFAAAGRRFLDAPSPTGYLEEWTERLISPIEETATDLQSVLIFRLGEEWLALRVQVLLEVTIPRPVHRIPHRTELLAGLVNIRGELYLCVRLVDVLGIRSEVRGQKAEVGSQKAPAGRGKTFREDLYYRLK